MGSEMCIRDRHDADVTNENGLNAELFLVCAVIFDSALEKRPELAWRQESEFWRRLPKKTGLEKDWHRIRKGKNDVELENFKSPVL